MTIELRTTNTPPADPAERELYPVDGALEPAFIQRDEELATVAGLTTAERRTLERDTVDLVRAIGVDPICVGRHLFDVRVDAIIAERRGIAEDPALIQQHAEETRRQVLGTYGLEEGEALLARVDKFCQQFPKLDELLQTRGISRPDVIVPLVEHVRTINFR